MAIRVKPWVIEDDGSARVLLVFDPESKKGMAVPVTHIDSLVSALYRLREGQLTGSERYDVVAKKPKH